MVADRMAVAHIVVGHMAAGHHRVVEGNPAGGWCLHLQLRLRERERTAQLTSWQVLENITQIYVPYTHLHIPDPWRGGFNRHDRPSAHYMQLFLWMGWGSVVRILGCRAFYVFRLSLPFLLIIVSGNFQYCKFIGRVERQSTIALVCFSRT